jgi:hypothetical protein
MWDVENAACNLLKGQPFTELEAEPGWQCNERFSTTVGCRQAKAQLGTVLPHHVYSIIV